MAWPWNLVVSREQRGALRQCKPTPRIQGTCWGTWRPRAQVFRERDTILRPTREGLAGDGTGGHIVTRQTFLIGRVQDRDTGG